MRYRLVAAMLAAAAVLGGCSHGDEPRPVSTGSSGTAGSAATTTVTPAGAPSVAPVDPADYCAAARRFAGVDLASARQPALLRQSFAELRAVLPVMQSSGPVELRADLAAVVDGYRRIGDLAEKDAWNWSTMAGAVMAIGEDRVFTAAGERVDAYNQSVCGVVPIGGTTTTVR